MRRWRGVPYRDSAKEGLQIVDTYDVLHAKGAFANGVLLAIVIIFLVVFGVSVFGGTPRELEGWVWTFPAGAAIFAVPTIWIWLKRKRTLHLVRDGDTVKLVVNEEVELTFPLVASGAQHTEHMRGVPLYHVSLKLVGREGRGIVLREVRGAVHGPLREWFTKIDEKAPAVAYEVSRRGQAEKLRARVEELNHLPAE
jgi:hypothetical protein